jgi:hypothetical protein
MEHELAVVEGLLVRQRSLVTLAQLEAAGVDKDKRYRLVKRKVLQKGAPKVFGLAGVENSYERRLLAAQMSPTCVSLVSHSGGAYLWDNVVLPELFVEICVESQAFGRIALRDSMRTTSRSARGFRVQALSGRFATSRPGCPSISWVAFSMMDCVERLRRSRG